MHELEELRADEDADGLFMTWACECGDQGRAATQQTAHTGWRKHVEKSDRIRCRIITPSSPG